MATPYSTIYESFLSNISDADLLAFDESGRENMLHLWLEKAQSDFERIAKVDLSNKDDVLEQYNDDLSQNEIEILVLGMIYYWLMPKVYFNDNLSTFLNTKDFSTISPANMLKELSALRKTAWNDFNKAIIRYSYVNGDLENLKP